MTKVEKIVLLINLLHHRQYITIEEIQRVCGISIRTAYRYLNSISEVNIPVQYDKTVGGYRVDCRDSFDINELGVSDSVLISVALQVLSQKLDDAYRENVEALRRKIFSKLPIPLEELWESFGARVEEGLKKESVSDLITSLLIHTSVLHCRKLRLILSDEKQDGNAIEIANPSLRFKQEWWLGDSMSDDHEAIPVSRVKKAVIL